MSLTPKLPNTLTHLQTSFSLYTCFGKQIADGLCMFVDVELQCEDLTVDRLKPCKSIISGIKQSNTILSCCREAGPKLRSKKLFDIFYDGSLLLLHSTVSHYQDPLPISSEIY